MTTHTLYDVYYRDVGGDVVAIVPTGANVTLPGGVSSEIGIAATLVHSNYGDANGFDEAGPPKRPSLGDLLDDVTAETVALSDAFESVATVEDLTTTVASLNTAVADLAAIVKEVCNGSS